jgi:hypothetical protein
MRGKVGATIIADTTPVPSASAKHSVRRCNYTNWKPIKSCDPASSTDVGTPRGSWFRPKQHAPFAIKRYIG